MKSDEVLVSSNANEDSDKGGIKKLQIHSYYFLHLLRQGPKYIQ